MTAEERAMTAAMNRVIARLRVHAEEGLKLGYVRNPIAWALYQTWKDVDSGELGRIAEFGNRKQHEEALWTESR